MTNNEIRGIIIKEFGSLPNFFKHIGAKNPHQAANSFKRTNRRNIAIEFIAKNIKGLRK
jgi:hypothetical protein